MATLERRICALEQATVNPDDLCLPVVCVEDGESTADAIERAGYSNDSRHVICVSFVGADRAES